MKINFVKIGKFFTIISIILCIISLIIIFNKKLSLGLEFNGGTEIEIKIENDLKIIEIKKELSKIKNTKINYYGSNKNIQIRTKNDKKNINEIKNILEKIDKNDLKIIKYSYIGSEINLETVKKSILAIIVALLGMTIYLSLRFNKMFAFSTILTLIHDILLIIGLISFLEIEIDLIILAAIFTIFGYSVNDTIIIFDRIREQINNNDNSSLNDIINNAINSTISRTISTSLSTLMVTVILAIFCGDNMFLFSIILTIGIIIGTYSSIYISAIPLTFLKQIK